MDRAGSFLRSLLFIVCGCVPGASAMFSAATVDTCIGKVVLEPALKPHQQARTTEAAQSMCVTIRCLTHMIISAMQLGLRVRRTAQLEPQAYCYGKLAATTSHSQR